MVLKRFCLVLSVLHLLDSSLVAVDANSQLKNKIAGPAVVGVLATGGVVAGAAYALAHKKKSVKKELVRVPEKLTAKDQEAATYLNDLVRGIGDVLTAVENRENQTSLSAKIGFLISEQRIRQRANKLWKLNLLEKSSLAKHPRNIHLSGYKGKAMVRVKNQLLLIDDLMKKLEKQSLTASIKNRLKALRGIYDSLSKRYEKVRQQLQVEPKLATSKS